jgi:hypothetical protein
MAGAHGMHVAGLGPVEIVESLQESYFVEFANGRRETVRGSGTLAVGTAGPRPYPLGATVLVRFGDGIDYAGRVAGIEPGRHRVRARDGRELWVRDHDLYAMP